MGDTWNSTVAAIAPDQAEGLAASLAEDLQKYSRSLRVSVVMYSPGTGPSSIEVLSYKSQPVVLSTRHPLMSRALEPLVQRGFEATAAAFAVSGSFLLAVRASMICGLSHYLDYSDATSSSSVFELRLGSLVSGYSTGALGGNESVTLGDRPQTESEDYGRHFEESISRIPVEASTLDGLFERYYSLGVRVITKQLS